MGTLMSSSPFLSGGMDMVVQFWKDDGEGFGDAWKWQGLLGIVIGVIGGIFLWRWLMLVTGLYTKEEMDQFMGKK